MQLLFATVRADSRDEKRRRRAALCARNRLQEALYFWIFPNFMLNIYLDNVSTNLILPISQEKTLTVFEWFFHHAESSGKTARTTFICF
jgi:phenylpropionate dioxygenase-like ring-hydroxylating dioxygenase large terminal subunit